MKLLTRKQFRQYWEEIQDGLGDNDSPLWTVEKSRSLQCRWFVSVKPLHGWDEYIDEDHPQNRKQEFWRWCRRHCQGKVLCYATSGKEEEWWGFTIYEDIVPWVMKWG